ncbi:MAG: large subunit ribosomal protein [Pseudomonadota bacterium]|nr:large subunit ribosomal protein [Pseudomonadota bacterium]
MTDQNVKKLKITLVKSLIGRLEAHKSCARGLGLSKIRQTVEVLDSVENRGMINRISYLLKCEG